MRRLALWPKKREERQQPPQPVAHDESAALRSEVRALSEAIDRLSDKLEQAATPPKPPATLRGYANENTGAITLLALIVAIGFGIATALNSVNADMHPAGRWLLLLTVAIALTIGFELVLAGLRATSLAWDAVTDQALERRPKVVSVAAAVRLTLFAGLLTVAVLLVGLYTVVAEPSFSKGLLQHYIVPLVALLFVPEAIGRWAAWPRRPRGRVVGLLGVLVIIGLMIGIVWFLQGY